MFFRKLCALALIIGSLIATARFCHRQTEGFRVAKIQDNFAPFSLPCIPNPEIENCLQGRFTYLGRGLQSFAFISEDGERVIKILNNRLQTKQKLWSLFSKTKAEHYAQKLTNVFHSYQIAWDELREETGLLFLHLRPTTLLQRAIEIVDKLGIAHRIDLDRTAFIVQKKATLAYPALAALRDRGALEEAKKATSELLKLIVKRCQKGISDNDPLIRTNFGFIGTQPLQIDVGPFAKEEAIQDPALYLPELDRITASLRDWSQAHYPELLPHLEQELAHLHENSH